MSEFEFLNNYEIGDLFVLQCNILFEQVILCLLCKSVLCVVI